MCNTYTANSISKPHCQLYVSIMTLSKSKRFDYFVKAFDDPEINEKRDTAQLAYTTIIFFLRVLHHYLANKSNDHICENNISIIYVREIKKRKWWQQGEDFSPLLQQGDHKAQYMEAKSPQFWQHGCALYASYEFSNICNASESKSFGHNCDERARCAVRCVNNNIPCKEYAVGIFVSATLRPS